MPPILIDAIGEERILAEAYYELQDRVRGGRWTDDFVRRQAIALLDANPLLQPVHYYDRE